MKQFVDIEAVQHFIARALAHYQERGTPYWFNCWLDTLYMRLGENWREITLDEIVTLSTLEENSFWMTPALAVNTIYHLFDRLGRSTEGMVSY